MLDIVFLALGRQRWLTQPLPLRTPQPHCRVQTCPLCYFLSAWRSVVLGEFSGATSEATWNNNSRRQVTVDQEGEGAPRGGSSWTAPGKGEALSGTQAHDVSKADLRVFLWMCFQMTEQSDVHNNEYSLSPPELNVFSYVYTFLEKKVRNQWY